MPLFPKVGPKEVCITWIGHASFLIQLAGMNVRELHRELRLVLGQAWDDELEPFRHASDMNSIVWLHNVG